MRLEPPADWRQTKAGSKAAKDNLNEFRNGARHDRYGVARSQTCLKAQASELVRARVEFGKRQISAPGIQRGFVRSLPRLPARKHAGYGCRLLVFLPSQPHLCSVCVELSVRATLYQKTRIDYHTIDSSSGLIQMWPSGSTGIRTQLESHA